MCTLPPMRCFVSPHGFVYVLRHASRLSKTPHFWGLCIQRGLRPSNLNSVEIFIQCTYPPSFIILCLLVRKLSCWQRHTQTNEQTHKQTPLKTSNILRYATTMGNYAPNIYKQTMSIPLCVNFNNTHELISHKPTCTDNGSVTNEKNPATPSCW